MKGEVFKDKGQLFMVKCPYCFKENYALSVSSGQCAWCGKFAKEEHVTK